jgi:hypothetical protein
MRRPARFILSLALAPAVALATGVGGSAAVEARRYHRPGLAPEQVQSDLSIVLKPTYSRVWDDDRATLDMTPFYRWDAADDERTHFDLRELAITKAWRDWEVRAGIRKVTWGVTESRHLVDVLNQTDTLEGLRGDEKLGQPMLDVAWITGAGNVELYYLPYFRQRRFPGEKGRLRPPLAVDESQTTYAAKRSEWQPDWAVRWSGASPVDFGISYFVGTNREPELRVALGGDGRPVLAPHFGQMRQAGLDLQYALDAWLLKLEAIERQTEAERFAAAVLGLEYALDAASGASWSLFLEGGKDERKATSYWLERYVFAGLRVASSGLDTKELEIGVTMDTETATKAGSVEAKWVLAKNMGVRAELFQIWDTRAKSALYPLRHDGYAQIGCEYYF